MAESRREDEEEEDEEGERSGLRNRGQATDLPGRAKPEQLHPSQGPLSSIRAAIKRTKTNSQSDNTRDRRRPEITIISAEPIVGNNWFSGTSVVFPPHQSGWSPGLHFVSQPPPSYDQVIKEKTEEEHTVQPTAAPRLSACSTTTSGTQTDPARQNPATSVPPHSGTPQLIHKTNSGKKPQKPPRPSLPKPAPETAWKVAPVTTAQVLNYSRYDLKQPEKQDFTHTCTRSVTVHWDSPPDCPPVTSVPAETTPSSSNSKHSQHPIPRPRTKILKQPIKEECKDQTLVQLSENCGNTPSDLQGVSSNKYLKELLEVFGADNQFGEIGDVFQVDEGDDAISDMNNNNGQSNMKSRILAFESQVLTEEEHVYESIKPEPRPRKSAVKPPLAAKPSVALKPQFSQSLDNTNQNNQNVQTTTADNLPNPTPAPRPLPPRKPEGLSIKEELELIHSKARSPNGSRRSVLTRSSRIYEEDPPQVLPAPAPKPVKEPLKANLNINNHNSASVVTGNDYVESPTNNIPYRPQLDVDSNRSFSTRESLTKRPTTIRVPSKTKSLSDNFQDNPPPLPAQKPVGSLKQSLSFQDPFSAGPQPTLPPRRPSVAKALPPRPPPAKVGPGRPPAPSFQSTGPSHSASWEASPAPQTHRPQGKGPVLPPRPNPGHRLYNKYTLQLAHGIASFDHNGNNSGELSFQKNDVLLLLNEIDHNHFECQVADTRGRVHKSHIKVITPLDTATLQDASPAALDGDGYGLKVQALYDFNSESPGELSLRAGDVVTHVEQVDSEWYKGACRGSAGFFPITHVKVLSNSPKLLPARKPKPPPAPSVSGPRCLARFDFEGEHSDELSFCEGDVIQLKEYLEHEWARGQIGGSSGIFPLNFVEIIEDLPPPPSNHQPPTKIALPGMVAAPPSVHHEVAKPAQASQPAVEWAVALYDYAGMSEDDLSFQQGDCILITQHNNAEWSSGRLNGKEGMFPTSFVEAKTPGQQLSNNQQNGTAGGMRARALYNFSSECEEELSLKVGDIITNLESANEEWFLGDLSGRRAMVPKNYVQVLP